MTAPTPVAPDHNFPETMVDAIAPYVPEAVLRPIYRIDRRLAQLDDWQLVVALGHRGFPLLATLDAHFLDQPRVLPAAEQSRVSLAVIGGLGHDPARAAGALLLDLPAILKQVTPQRSLIFKIERRATAPHPPRHFVNQLANRKGVSPRTLFEQERLRGAELGDPRA